MTPTVGNGHGSVPHDVHKTTGVTPNMAMLGREVMMPAALIARPPEEPYTTSVPFVNNLRDTLRDAHHRVRNATRSSARTQKSYYDERAHVISFDVGQLVWLYWPRPPVRQRFRKLQRLWTCLLYTSPSPLDRTRSRMPSSA